jgi:2-(1,2-epoxy-1,2-dihydrophenyl)acetyl-CoA isomerase
VADEKPLEEQLQYRVENGVGWITLNRPEAHNALTPQQRDRMFDLVEAANGNFDVRALVITATGPAFCTGADLRVQRDPIPRPPEAPERVLGEPRMMMLKGQIRLMMAIMDCEKPIIAAVNGTAAGVGAHLAFCCDLVVAAESARFIEVFVRRGLVPDGLGTYILPRIIGLQKAKELVFFGDDLPAPKAKEIGLVNEVVADGELEATARAWAERLASGPTKSLMLSKWLLNRSLDVDRNTLVQEEAWAVELITTTLDMQEGVASFVERRKPVWRGY